MDVINPDFVRYSDKAEVVAESFIKNYKKVLPTIGRILLVSTFIEDGLRMWYQWGNQRDFICLHWNQHYIIGTLFVLYNLLGQLIPAGLVVARKHIRPACGVLMTIVLTQTIVYHVLWSTTFFCRNISLIGALMLLVAETFEVSPRNFFAGLPSLEDKLSAANYIQLLGRVTLVFLFITIQHWDLTLFNVVESVFACALMFAVTVGWKTKMSALLLAIYLFAMNLYVNSFWTLDYDSYLRDLYKYDFFLTLSISGGLCMLVSVGPGKVSLDQRKAD